MVLNIKSYVNYNLSELFKNGFLIIGILCALAPAVLVSYLILSDAVAFNIKHVSNFFCMLGMLAAVLHPLYLVNRDYASKTITLINNSQKNRVNYVVANVVIAFFVSLFYASIGALLLIVAKQLGVPGELEASFLFGFLVNVFLLVMTFFLFGYLLILFGMKSGAIYTILTAMLLFFHNILGNIVYNSENTILTGIIENFPGYFYPVMVGSNPLSPLQYSIGVVTLLVLLFLVVRKSKKIEF
ncbi:ABC transporter permease [Chryseomicrobium excrementi]|uniref:ABC transporter permease n=1 Tax=Chryseomicrobium excrementi TaxID=2041346 RepID=A0A2M9EY83_9BACL|nr:ABC transporter permease [Chryseomicrobium excrementi]PJK16162.1 ABC transporter permease [Chryseomicrobium excrementi]